MEKTNQLDRFQQLCEVAGPIHDEQVDNILQTTKTQLETEHIPTVVCACTSSDRKLYQLPAAFGLSFDRSENQKRIDLVRRFADLLVIEYGETNNLYVLQNDLRIPAVAVLDGESEDSLRKYPMLMTLPDDYLQQHRLVIVSSLSTMLPEFIAYEADLICLKTNATMAMTQEERTWMETVLLPWHGNSRFQVWVDMLEHLNSEDDVVAVLDHVRETLVRLGLPAQNVTSAIQFADWAGEMFADQEQLDKLRSAQITKSCFRQVKEYVENEISRTQVDTELTQRAKSQIERQHKSLELAGQIASRTVVKNEYENLKFRLLNDVERYCKEACENCIREVQSSTDAQTTADAIQRYLDYAWQQYQVKANQVIQKETAEISERLMRQMEIDTGELFNKMDQDVQMLLGRAMKLNTAFRSVSGVDWEASQEALKREARNIMLLSVPLLLINPTWSIAALVGAQIYKKYKGNALDTQLIAQLKDDIQQQCKQAQESLSISLATGLDQAAQQSAENVQDAYNNLVGLLQQKLDELVRVCDEAKDRSEKLLTLQSALQAEG